MIPQNDITNNPLGFDPHRRLSRYSVVEGMQDADDGDGDGDGKGRSSSNPANAARAARSVSMVSEGNE